MSFNVVKDLSKQSVIYGLGSVTTQALGFILLPIYTRQLPLADYGILSLLMITLNIAIVIIQMGLGSAIFREVVYRESEQNQVLSTTLFFLIIESSLTVFVFVLLARPLSQLLFKSSEYAGLLRLLMIVGGLSIFEIVTLAKLRMDEKPGLYSTLAVSKFILGAFANIYFVVVAQDGLDGVIKARFFQEAIFVLVYVIILYKDLYFTFSLQILKRLLVFGVPLVPFGLSRMVLTSADHYILLYFSNTEEVALYSLGYKLGMVMNLIVQAIQLAWPKHMFSIAKQADAERLLSKLVTNYVSIVGFIGLALSVLSRDIIRIMTTPSYYEAYKVVPFAAISYLLYGVGFMVNSGIETRNKVKYIVPIIGFVAILNVTLGISFIPKYGMMGAAWITLASYLMLTAIQIIINIRVWYISYEYGRIFRIGLAWLLVYLVSLQIFSSNIFLDITIKSLILGAYPLLIISFRVYRIEEILSVARQARASFSGIAKSPKKSI